MPAEDYQITLSKNYSGNVTLNKLLRRGGFTLPHDKTCGLVVLLRGKPGTGKSTLALQILDGLELMAKKEEKDQKQKGEPVLPLNKYYCSVEQTVIDLHFKRLSMLVAQAILSAWEPKYDDANPEASKLVCNPKTFLAHLPKALQKEISGNATLKKSMMQLLTGLSIPLFEGPSDKNHILPNEAKEIAEHILRSQAGKFLTKAEERINLFLAAAKDNSGEEGGSKRKTVSYLEQRIQQVFLDCRLGQGGRSVTKKNAKAIAIEKTAHLLFEREITQRKHDLCFRGLEDDVGAMSADEPFSAGRSRSLGALRMLDAIVAELQGKVPGGDRDRAGRPVVVIDGLSLLANSEREMLEIQGVVDRLRQLAQIGIIVYEPNEDESVNLDHHADMVIELQRKELKDPMAYLIHEICLKKARYQETALGQHQFKIRRSGLVFFPSVHFHIQHASYMDFEVVRSTPKEYKPVADPTKSVVDPGDCPQLRLAHQHGGRLPQTSRGGWNRFPVAGGAE